MFNNLIGKNKELGRFLFCERYTLQPVKNAMYIAEGQELKRGAVVDVNGVLVGTNSTIPYAVLEFDCDTRDGGKQESVFTKGEFNFDKLSFASGLSKSDMDNIVYNGNSIGIVIKPYEYDEGFEPIMAPSASKDNPLMTAEETERMIDAMKPIDDMTLRFEFSKKDYNPETAGVGSAGTWTKVDSPTLNVWDWTNDETDWSNAFKDAFIDPNNEVRVISAGDTSTLTTLTSFFSATGDNRTYLKSICLFDTSNVTQMNGMFQYNILLKTIPAFDTSNVTTMKSMFRSCESLEEIPSIDTSNVTDMTQMFLYCERLKKVPMLNTSKVTLMKNMFAFCYLLEELPINDTSLVTNIDSFLNRCYSLKYLPTLDFSKVETASSAFYGLNVDSLPDMDLSVCKIMNSIITDCHNLKRLPNIIFADTITNANRAFENNYSVSENIYETYHNLSLKTVTTHTYCFNSCGIDTEEGRAALAQIPASWGGTAEG